MNLGNHPALLSELRYPFAHEWRGAMPGANSPGATSPDANQPDTRTPDANNATDSDLLVKERTRNEPPSLYKVILLNDDYTPMEFVVGILESLFHRSHLEAVEIMLNIHNKGVGICGLYPHEIAETKATQVMSLARKNEHPLQCVIEKEDS